MLSFHYSKVGLIFIDAISALRLVSNALEKENEQFTITYPPEIPEFNFAPPPEMRHRTSIINIKA